jgi:hypothetical protein
MMANQHPPDKLNRSLAPSLAVHGVVLGPIAAQSDRLTEAYHPWTNACVENVFNTLKREPVWHWHYATREDAIQHIFEYIKVFYHRKRRHVTLD